MYVRHILPGAALVLLMSGMGACKPAADRNRTDTASPPAETGALPADTAGPAPASAGWTDANIAALLDHANAADSTAGALAVTKATNPEVKRFAKRMMGEHHALRQAGADLAKRLKLAPELPADDPVTALADNETQALQSAPKGAEFDRTYIDQEVGAHQAVLDLLDKSHDQADNAELKALIEKAKPVVQKHLDQAQAIQKKLPAHA